MEISRKEKFSTKKKAAKKWPKIVLATTIALGVGTTSAYAANPNLANDLYNKIMEYTYQSEIESELNKEKNDLLKNVNVAVKGIVNDAKKDLDNNKEKIIQDKKKELETHYKQELAEITKRKNEAVNKKTENMSTDATRSSEQKKADISSAIQKEIQESDINKK
jgi:hypothetical protein